MGRAFKMMHFYDFIQSLKQDIGPTLENSVHDITSKAAIDKINDLFPLHDKSVLDVGCGLGRDMKYMEKTYGARVWGITLNEEEFDKSEIETMYLFDMHNLCYFPGESYDLVYASHVLEHSPIPLLVLKNFHKILKPGAICYVEVPSPQPWSIDNQNHYSIFSKEMWLQLFKKADFECVNQFNFDVQIRETEDSEAYINDTFWGFILKKNA